MKKYLLTILTSFAITQGIYSQTDKKQIADIEKVTKEIKNNIGKYKKTEELKDSVGNSRYIYKDGNELKLVTIYFQDTDANKNVEWYFTNGQLIYSQQTWTDKKTNKVVDNQKCYLSSGHLITWVKNDKLVDTNSEEFKKVGVDLPVYGTKMFAETK